MNAPYSGVPLCRAPIIGRVGLGVGMGHLLQQGGPKACFRLQCLHNLSLDCMLDALLQQQHLQDSYCAFEQQQSSSSGDAQDTLLCIPEYVHRAKSVIQDVCEIQQSLDPCCCSLLALKHSAHHILRCILAAVDVNLDASAVFSRST